MHTSWPDQRTCGSYSLTRMHSNHLGYGQVAAGVVFFVLLLSGMGCGDDTGGSGCTTDAECKGERICIDSQCVDPNGHDDAGPSVDDDDSGTAGRPAADGGGSGNPAEVVDDPELEEACTRDCEAKHAVSCEVGFGSLDQCRGSCLIVDEQSPYCLEERTAQYDCLAAGGYTCASGYPQPKSTCIAEATALNECTQRAPCRGFCERAEGECAASGQAACVTECEEKLSGFDDSLCTHYYSQLLTCWGTNLECADGRPSVVGCEYQFSEVADCVGRRTHDCDGYCWAAEALGCGSETCVADCKAKYDESYCGYMYRNVLDCAYGNSGSNALNMSCESGELVLGSACDSAVQQFDACVQAM